MACKQAHAMSGEVPPLCGLLDQSILPLATAIVQARAARQALAATRMRHAQNEQEWLTIVLGSSLYWAASKLTIHG
jgi:hypothetical protein